MKILLSIDHNTFLLPDDKNIASIQKSLSQAFRCDDERYHTDSQISLRDPISVKVEYLPPTIKFSHKGKPAQPFKASRKDTPLRLVSGD